MHPPNYTPTHGWGICHRFQIFKQNRIILISSSVIEFLLNLGFPQGVAGGWIGVGVGMGVWGMFHACMHMHMHACCKHDKHGCLNGGSHLQFLYMYTCLCVCVHSCTYVCTWMGTPLMLPEPPPSFPLPRAAGSPKHQNSISHELIKIFRFCLKILYL